jgi:hypothetical protein
VRGAIDVSARIVLETTLKCRGNILCVKFETRIRDSGSSDQYLQKGDGQIQSVPTRKRKTA